MISEKKPQRRAAHEGIPMSEIMPIIGTRLVAEFEPVRTIRSLTIGWATVATDDVTVRFPAVVHGPTREMVTVRDWQAPDWRDCDLSDRRAVREMLKTGAGQFMRPGTYNDSIMARHFANYILVKTDLIPNNPGA